MLQKEHQFRKSLGMGYTFTIEDARAYDRWIEDLRKGGLLGAIYAMIGAMLVPACGDRILYMGCATGASLLPFVGRGLLLTGVDPSPVALSFAAARLGTRVDLNNACLEDLPFDDNAFDFSIFFFSLEFAGNPALAIEEACRVTRQKVLVLFWNKYSPRVICGRPLGRLPEPYLSNGRFYGSSYVKSIFFNLLGEVPLCTRSISAFCANEKQAGIMRFLSAGRLLQVLFSFSIVCADIVPRFLTRPMPLKCPAGTAAASGENLAASLEIEFRP